MVVIGLNIPSSIEPLPDGGSRNLSALLATGLFSRFKELLALPGLNSWNGIPTWRADSRAERESLELLGLSPSDEIPMPLPVMAHGGYRSALFAFRGDAFAALGSSVDRLERAIEAGIRPAAEAAGVRGIRVEEVPTGHVLGNERTYYRVPRVDIVLDDTLEIKPQLQRFLALSFAAMAYGYKDRSKRLSVIADAFRSLRIESFGEPMTGGLHHGKQYSYFAPLLFSIEGRFDGPLFLFDRSSIERPCVATLDRNATAANRIDE